MFYHAVLALSFFSLPIPRAHAQSDVKASNESRLAADIERKRQEIKSTPDANGIKTGLVIVYGHPIPGPYKFEYRGAYLFVNNVQVEPSILRQREFANIYHKPTPEETQKYAELDKLERSAYKFYFEQKGKMPDDMLHAQILDMFLKHPLIRSAHWVSDDSLNYNATTTTNKFLEHGVSFVPDQNILPTPRPKRSLAEMQQKRIGRVEKDLKDGGCVFFMTEGGTWHTPSYKIDRFKDAVNQIMNHPELSDIEKQKQLLKFLDHAAGPTNDILANYNASEWK